MAQTKGFSLRICSMPSKVTRLCLRALKVWKQPWFLFPDTCLGTLSRRGMLTTDVSLTGWGAIMSDRSIQGLGRTIISPDTYVGRRWRYILILPLRHLETIYVSQYRRYINSLIQIPGRSETRPLASRRISIFLGT